MRILLVEDLTSDAVLLREALRDAGLGDDVVLAVDGQQALDLLLGGGPMPQLMLLDLNLPGVSGHEILRRVRSEPRLSTLPVVVLTTSASPADVAYVYSHHGNAYVRKPNGFEALTGVARAIRDFWIGAASLPPAFPA